MKICKVCHTIYKERMTRTQTCGSVACRMKYLVYRRLEWTAANKEYHKEYRLNNKEYHKEYRLNNTTYKEYQKKYRLKNKKKMSALQKNWYLKNKESINKQEKEKGLISRRLMDDKYIKKLLKQMGVPVSGITLEIINIKRSLLLLHRELKQARGISNELN